MAHQRQKKSSSGSDLSELSTDSCKSHQSKFESLFGFDLKDLSSVLRFFALLNRPMDPACLGVMRFMYGLLMLFDTIQERGLSGADLIFGDRNECYFPLFNFLHPLPVQWMIILYTVMAFGAFGIMTGFLYRLSCALFVIPYWYLFFLDKTTWNNHSYLFGLVGLLLLVSDANRYWSIDGLIWPEKRNSHVPLWSYTLLRTQFFFVYFLAGLKKLDQDWMTGYSMQKLSLHWVFFPFKLFLSTDQIDLYIVHLGGLFLDLTIGYLLFFDVTRPYAFFFGGSFHLMNSQIFSIGMFPWTMLATMPLFCYVDWPRALFRKFPSKLSCVLPLDDPPQPSRHCVYSKEQVKPEESSRAVRASTQLRDKPGPYHKAAAIGTVLYLAVQLFMPYSHFVTKGYNNWTNGLYGYSWDMMVHSWSLQHVKITYVKKDTGEVGYLKPLVWTRGKARWSSHADMVKQYATCIEQRLKAYNISNVELYFDVWRSMNKRFQQRMFDPRVNILEADWSVFSDTPWILPLLVDLSSWREELKNISKTFRNETEATDVVFVADFPGLHLENYIQEHLNTTLKVLRGEIRVEFESDKHNYSLSEGETMQLPADAFHTVYTVSDEPSCYMYVYVNTTYIQYVKNLSAFEDEIIKLAPKDRDGQANLTRILQSRPGDSPLVAEYKDSLRKKSIRQSIEQRPFWWGVLDFWVRKFNVFKRTYHVVRAGFTSVFTNQTVAEVMASLNKQPEQDTPDQSNKQSSTDTPAKEDKNTDSSADTSADSGVNQPGLGSNQPDGHPQQADPVTHQS
ncbi:vitamin K-dependent gamma-carboxylase-like [Liolophura sinensis]|uniref:vitamin K-dependent gamma-carboxylase-like n=1 Tax=Liolophura sinensis TaxID=3198878 RepID=UPI0031594237